MKKKCTNSACRKVFTFVAGHRRCPHCGRKYRGDRRMLLYGKRVTGLRMEYQGWFCAWNVADMQHVWMGFWEGEKRPAHTRQGRQLRDCAAIRAADRYAVQLGSFDPTYKLRCLKVLRGEDYCYGLKRVKELTEALMARPSLLHTDGVTLSAMVNSGWFPIERMWREKVR